MSAKSKFSFSKVISVTAGSLTITNFIFSLIPVANNPPIWYQKIINLNLNGKFIIAFLSLFLISIIINKLIVYIAFSNYLPSTKGSIVSILIIVFAWLTVFDLKGLAFNNSFTILSGILYTFTLLFFYIYNSIALHFDIKSQKLNKNPVTTAGPWVDNDNHNPAFVRALRFLLYWLIIIFGTFYFQF
jgi:hypothetical protein